MPRTARVGLNARNAQTFKEKDFALLETARIETLKTMSFTKRSEYEKARQRLPDLEFICRLWDDRFGTAGGRGVHPTPQQFCERQIPVMKELRGLVEKFEIHNEPNHVERYEGWGPEDEQARDFREWYQAVLSILRREVPWAKLGFPGLAVPEVDHRDLQWLEICKDVILASDWLGVHCYWQGHEDMMLQDKWGLRFKLYHERFPQMPLEITEFGNSTPSPEKCPPYLPVISREEYAAQYARYYQETWKYSYLGSACAFIASSPDPQWEPFAWMKESGDFQPVVRSVGLLERPPLAPVTLVIKPERPEEKPAEVPDRLYFDLTKKWVRGPFLEFYRKYGLDICGYPISDEFEEYGRPSQYFQRVALEVVDSRIQLKLVGQETLESRQKIAELNARIGQLEKERDTLKAEVDRLRQTAHSVVLEPEIVDIVDSLPKSQVRQYGARPIENIQYLVIHHTATSSAITPQRVAEYQVNTAGKPGIAYHFFITGDGTIYKTNRLETDTEHALAHSPVSVGICFAGNFMREIPSEAQLTSGGHLCAWLISTLKLSVDSIKGMNELYTSQSPGDQWLKGKRWKDLLLEKTNAVLATAVESKVPVLEQRIKELEAEITRLNGQATERMAEIARLNGQVAELEAETARLRSLLAEAPARKIPAPSIADIVDTLPQHSSKRYSTRSRSDIKYLVIHHTAIPAEVPIVRIARYHVDSNGWPGIGYHYYIDAQGKIFLVNRMETVAYHAREANSSGLAVCLAGNFMTEIPTEAQLKAAGHLCAWLLQELNLDEEAIKGHSDFIKTQCPGDQWMSGKMWKNLLLAQVRLYQAQVSGKPAGKTIGHYVLFWQYPDDWAKKDWQAALNYVGRFRPTCGFSVDDAMNAEYVTIVGGPMGVPVEVEQRLRSAGCKVERVAGKDEAETKQLLDDMAKTGHRFLTFEF